MTVEVERPELPKHFTEKRVGTERGNVLDVKGEEGGSGRREGGREGGREGERLLAR